jgi:hypothetical protein
MEGDGVGCSVTVKKRLKGERSGDVEGGIRGLVDLRSDRRVRTWNKITTSSTFNLTVHR